MVEDTETTTQKPGKYAEHRARKANRLGLKAKADTADTDPMLQPVDGTEGEAEDADAPKDLEDQLDAALAVDDTDSGNQAATETPETTLKDLFGALIGAVCDCADLTAEQIAQRKAEAYSAVVAKLTETLEAVKMGKITSLVLMTDDTDQAKSTLFGNRVANEGLIARAYRKHCR